MSTPFPDPIIKPFSNMGDNAPPPLGPISTAANQETGFPILEATPLNIGGIPITREEFNGTFNFYTKQILALVSGARFTFDQDLSDEQGGYPIGAVLYCASNNSLQRSLIDNNTFNFITTPAYVNDRIHWDAVVIDDIYAQIVNAYQEVAIGPEGPIKFFDSGFINYVSFKAPASLAAINNYILPIAYPDVNDYVLSSTTAGVLSWSPAGTIISSYASSVSLPLAGTRVNVTSITLPRGRWVISLQSTAFFSLPGAIIQQVLVSISPTSASHTGTVTGDNLASGTIYDTGTANSLTLSIANYPIITVASSTVFYFVANVSEITGFTTEISGRITAVCVGKYT